MAHPAAAVINEAGMKTYFVQRVPFLLSSSVESLSRDFAGAINGITELRYGGASFIYDSGDTTTAHDGIFTMVDASNRRFKQPTSAVLTTISVISITLTTPPVSPTVGDKYVVGVAATGAWSGQDKKIATYTSAGWVFESPRVGMAVYITGPSVYCHYSSSLVWTNGLAAVVSNNSVEPYHLKFPAGIFIQSVNNTPPVSPTNGQMFLVGVSPTGAFVGQSGSLAYRENSAWTFITPSNGWVVTEVTGQSYARVGGAWVNAGGALAAFSSQVATSGNTTTGGSSSYVYSSSTAPTTSITYREEGMSIVHTARRTGAVLRFTWRFAHNSDTSFVAALFRDSVANAVDWVNVPTQFATGAHHFFTFRTTAPDTSAHTWKFRQIVTSNPVVEGTRRMVTIEEFTS